MKLPRNAKIFRGQLDAAPFAGVLFLLLIFLVWTSRLVLTPGVPIALPEVTDQVPGIGGPTIVVAIDQMGEFYFESQIIQEPKLTERLKRALAESSEPLKLEIQVDSAARVQRPVELMNRARAIGFREAVIVVRPPLLPIPADRHGVQ